MSTTAADGDEPDRRSLVARVVRTPMRDLLRGRISGRLDVGRVVESSGLPEPLRGVILRTVRRTRLWRLEKVAVAEELVAHFADGLDAGRSAEKLMRDFGDTLTAARLIRRAKRRARPVPVRGLLVAMKATGMLLAVFIVYYAYAALQYYTSRPNPTHDYVADLNAPARALAEDERAWPIYREALLQLGSLPGPLAKRTSVTKALRPGMEGWDEIEAYVRTHADTLEAIRSARQLPGLGFEVGFGCSEEDRKLWPNRPTEGYSRGPDDVWQDSLAALLFPHLGQVRKLAALLDADAWRCVVDGESETFVANIDAMLSIGEQARHPLGLVQFCCSGIFKRAVTTIAEVLTDHPELLNDSQWQRIAHRLAGAYGGNLHYDYTQERIWFLDGVQRMYSDDGHGNGRLTSAGIYRGELAGLRRPYLSLLRVGMPPLQSALTARRLDMVHEFDRIMSSREAWARLPLWQRTAERTRAAQEERELSKSGFWRLRYHHIAILSPSLYYDSLRVERLTQRRDAVLAAIALELYRRKHGTWPETLDSLVPGFLPSVPPDRFDGEPLRYRLVNGRPLLYSVGADYDDDEGRPPVARRPHTAESLATWWRPRELVEGLKTGKRPPMYTEEEFQSAMKREVPDGDWVLWPPAPRAPARAANSEPQDDSRLPGMPPAEVIAEWTRGRHTNGSDEP